MSPFQFFALGLMTGTLLQLCALALCWLSRQGRGMWASCWPARACWLCGVLTLLAVAVYDRDPALFAGQALAAWGFWKTGLLDAS